MKFLVAVLTFGGVAFGAVKATDPYQVCGRMSFDQNKIQCLQAIKGKKFDPLAVGVCSNISFDNQVIDCLKAIAGLKFTANGIDLCSKISFSNQVIQCLSTAGEAVSQCPAYKEVFETVKDSIYFIEQERPWAAKRHLVGLAEKLHACDADKN